jgi:hypothetical protein
MEKFFDMPQARRLGDLLIEAGLINPDQLQKALGESKQTMMPDRRSRRRSMPTWSVMRIWLI